MKARVAAAVALGAGLTLIVWWPMLLLIRRSTRVLLLAAPDNDIAMPYSRLLALINPGSQGWAWPLELADKNPFTGYPNNAYFWDTASYVGILPLVAIAALLVECVLRKRMPDSKWQFLSCLGGGAFLLSLPLANPMLHWLPGTLLRSPARLLYLWTFCAAVALGAAVDWFRGTQWRGHAAIRNGLLVVGLSLHFVDMWGFAHKFVQLSPRKKDVEKSAAVQAFETILDRRTGSARVAKQWIDLFLATEDRYDDAGGFDSIVLARFNRGLLALAGSPPDLNPQLIDASELPVKALEATGVGFVITMKERTDLELAGSTEEANLYRVPDPAPRADFLSERRTQFVADQHIPELFAAAPKDRMLLPQSVRASSRRSGDRATEESAIHPSVISYSRPSSDEILLRIKSDLPGFGHVLEAYDPGWVATVDGAPAPVVPANGFEIAVPVEAGNHTVRLRYNTPGRAMGMCLSLLSLALLAVLIESARSRA
jgi:hypothetical protein